MEHSVTMHHNFILNTVLVSITTGTGFISTNYQEQLKDLSLLLTPLVQLCSLTSFVCFLIVNHASIGKVIKIWFKHKK